jgi:uncharacterized protein HemY
MKDIIKFIVGCIIAYFILCFFPLFMIAIFIYGAYKLGDKAYNYFSDNKIKITRKNGKNNS